MGFREGAFGATNTFRPVSRLKLDEIYYLTRLRTRTDSFLGASPAAVFVNHLVRSRLNYQFTRELSLRLILDYNGVIENPLLIDLERQKRVTGADGGAGSKKGTDAFIAGPKKCV